MRKITFRYEPEPATPTPIRWSWVSKPPLNLPLLCRVRRWPIQAPAGLVSPICRPSLTARHNLWLGMNTEGIFLAERIFGVAITNSEGKQVPVRYLGEQHVKEDLGRIPTAADWLSQIRPQRWMYGQILTRAEMPAEEV